MPIIFSDIAVEFEGRRVLQGVSGEIREGELTVLIGPSGAGKTTLLSVIAGVRRIDVGAVKINGLQPNPAFAVWVPQGANSLPSRTLLENVMIAPLSDGRSRSSAISVARSCLELVGLDGREESCAQELSGGELQRLSIARALASNRAMILADEPTANLDLATSREIIKLLRSIRIERMLIVATHDTALMSAADEIIDLRAVDSR